MKKARLLFSTAMIAVAGMTTMTFTSCQKDEVCPTGYEGKDCKTLSRDKFIGTWTGSDACTSGNYEIDLTVSASTTSEIHALVNNPGGFGGTVTITGQVTDENTLTFTNANLGGARTLSGTMSVTGNSMTFNYTVTPAAGVADVCNGTYTKL